MLRDSRLENEATSAIACSKWYLYMGWMARKEIDYPDTFSFKEFIREFFRCCTHPFICHVNWQNSRISISRNKFLMAKPYSKKILRPTRLCWIGRFMTNNALINVKSWIFVTLIELCSYHLTRVWNILYHIFR